MKKNLFLAFLLLAGTLFMTSCPEPEPGPDPVPSDMQVRKAGNMAFFYDNFNHFDGFMKDGKSFHLDNNNVLSFSYYDMFSDEDARHIINQFALTINDRGLVSKIEFKAQFVYDEDELEYRINGNIVYGYDKAKQVTGISMNARREEIRREDGFQVSDETETVNVRHTTTWKNGLLTDFEAKEKATWVSSVLNNGRWDDNIWNEESTTKGMIIYGSQKNTPRQLPATLCEVALCDMCIPEFSIIGLYGAGPTHLPTSCTIYETETKDDGSTENDEENHTFNIVSNSDGTIASEALDKDTPMQYQYSTTRALTEEEAAHVIAGLKKILKIER